MSNPPKKKKRKKEKKLFLKEEEGGQKECDKGEGSDTLKGTKEQEDRVLAGSEYFRVSQKSVNLM